MFQDDKENVLPPDVEIGASSAIDENGTNLTMVWYIEFDLLLIY